MSLTLAYDYTIAPDADNKQFVALCRKIANEIGAELQHADIDVDGSIICEYLLNGKLILAYNDYEIGAIYVKSDVDLSTYLN